MTIKAAGNPLEFSEIEAEFGAQSPRSLGAYRHTQTVDGLTFNGIDTGIPTSGEIAFSDFYGKSLNIVVDCFSNSGTDEFRINAKKNKWNNNKIVIINPSTVSKKESGTKIIIRVNKRFGSNKNSVNNCALRTGTWNNPASLTVDMGSNAKVLGAGGNGGDGADGIQNNAGDGRSGTSGLGIEHQGTIVNVRSGSIIRAGYGGGGGGGGGRETSKHDRRAGGGGGGGGAGFPIGNGGKKGVPTGGKKDGGGEKGANGSPGTATVGGAGGAGGDNHDQAFGGKGGDGGQNGKAAEDGDSSTTEGFNKNKQNKAKEGAGGGNGAAIRKTSGISFSFGVNSGTITGSQNATGVA